MTEFTDLIEVYKERAAEVAENAFEAGYDDAALEAYGVGYWDGIEQGRKEILDHVEATKALVEVDVDVDGSGEIQSAPADACDCCTEVFFIGDPDVDFLTLAEAHNELAHLVGDLETALDDWAPTVDGKLDLLALASNTSLDRNETLLSISEALLARVEKLETEAELAEADAVFLEDLANRVAALEGHKQGQKSVVFTPV